MGGPQEAFPETAWTSILRDPDSPRSREALNELCLRYWRPVYAFLRAAGGRTVEDAKDLAQEFFQHVSEGEFLSRYRPERGRFRDFLKGSLRRFLSRVDRDRRRLKRGGGRAPVSLDAEAMESAEFLADLTQRTPEEIFDLQWGEELLRRSVEILETRLREEDKEIYFRVYREYDLAPAGSEPTYGDIARRCGLKPHDVENYLSAARQKLQGILAESISDYVTGRQELMEELKELFSS